MYETIVFIRRVLDGRSFLSLACQMITVVIAKADICIVLLYCAATVFVQKIAKAYI